jgi:hypothetical protein
LTGRNSFLLVCLLGAFLSVRSSPGQEFKVGDYRARALIGEPRLVEGREYVSFAGDTGFRDWLPDPEAMNRWLTQEANLLAHFDLSVVNLEYGLPGFSGRPLDDRIDRTVTEALRRLGYSLVSVANNHVLDSGSEGVSHSVTGLQEANFQIIGLRTHPVYIWQAGIRRIAIYSLTAYTDKNDPDRLTLKLDDAELAWIQRLTSQADYRIAFVHMGSMSSFPSEHERRETLRLIEHGADLVVCTGSHFLKGFVLERGRPVVYGLGDHLFSSVNSGIEALGLHLVAGFGPSGLEQLFVVPFWNDIRGGTTGPLDNASFRAFEKLFRERSTADTSRYYSDPRSLESLKNSVSRLRFADLQRLGPRQCLYAVRIVWRNYPFAVASAGVLMLVPVALLIRQRRRRGLGGFDHRAKAPRTDIDGE